VRVHRHALPAPDLALDPLGVTLHPLPFYHRRFA
jgi:hypothetical protein